MKQSAFVPIISGPNQNVLFLFQQYQEIKSIFRGQGRDLWAKKIACEGRGSVCKGRESVCKGRESACEVHKNACRCKERACINRESACEVHKNACRCKERACIIRESTEALRVFAGVLKYQWRSCERSRGHESASRGCKSANKGRERAHSGRRRPQRALQTLSRSL